MRVRPRLHALALVLFIYLCAKLAVRQGNNTANVEQAHRTAERRRVLAQQADNIFVALVQQKHSSAKAVESARRTWLHGVQHQVFTHNRTSWSDRVRLQFPSNVKSGLSEVLYLSSYLHVMHPGFRWYLFVQDSSFVVFENLNDYLQQASLSSPRFAIIENPQNTTYHMLVLNRKGLEAVATLHGSKCTSRKSTFSTCLMKQTSSLEAFSIDRDADGHRNYVVQSRNDKGEQPDAKWFRSVSSRSHSFHNLNDLELRWFHAVIYGLN